jgi:uncharacterized membrane protein
MSPFVLLGPPSADARGVGQRERLRRGTTLNPLSPCGSFSAALIRGLSPIHQRSGLCVFADHGPARCPIRTVCDAHSVRKGRLEAFTDAVIAIVMTIMVLDLRPPAGQGFGDLKPLIPKLLVYALSFTFLAIYWNNHHHLLHVVERVDGRVLWANMGLLFSLSLTPAATAWLGEHPRSTAPAVVYGFVLLLSAIAYYLLTRALLALHPMGSRLALAIGSDFKGRLSAAAYGVAIVIAFVEPLAAIAVYVAVAVIWLVPDRRISRVLDQGGETTH